MRSWFLSILSACVLSSLPAFAQTSGQELARSPWLASEHVPLKTKDQWLVGTDGQRVKLRSVNWYGASDGYNVVGGLDKNTLPKIVELIRGLGFNSVRLPFSNDMLRAPAVPLSVVSANPELAGKRPLEVFDAVVDELTKQGVMVILNNHTTSSVWCCGYDDNALWFNNRFTADEWVRDWETLAQRYMSNPMVIGADLRNELRWGQTGTPNWGMNDRFDWLAAATAAGNRILAINPNLLIIVEGLSYANDFSGLHHKQMTLNIPNRVVYSSHSYSWFHSGNEGLEKYADFKAGVENQWGFISSDAEGAIRAPLWIGEFGAGPNDHPAWLTFLVQYIKDKDLDWCIWPLNMGPRYGGVYEAWGLITDDWQHPLNDWRVQLLRTIQ